MARFVNSMDSVSSSLMLWSTRPTQIAIEDTFTQKIWPVQDNLNTDNPSTFNVPPQPNGMLTDIEIVTKFHVKQTSNDDKFEQKFSVVNNFANSLWSLVEVKVDDRIDLMQSMNNAYAYTTFLNHALNSDSLHEDYLFYNELFQMDDGADKQKGDVPNQFWLIDDEKIGVLKSEINADSALTDEQKVTKIAELDTDIECWKKNPKCIGAANRSMRVHAGESITVSAKLQCPLLNTSKCLPTNMKIRISLTKNTDNFLLLKYPDAHHPDARVNIIIDDVYLSATYYRPRDQILKLIESRLQKEPAPYFISKPEIIIKPVAHQNRIIRITDVFHDKIPPYAFFFLQKSEDFEGSQKSNPFNFIPFKRFQFYINGKPYFNDALEVGRVDEKGMYHEFGEFMRQLYRTVGKDLKGNCLINSSNFLLHFMVGMSFGADKNSISENHLNLHQKGTTYLEIDMGINEDDVPKDMILITYAVHDRQILIDGNRQVRIIE